jgi:hypothetical protein
VAWERAGAVCVCVERWGSELMRQGVGEVRVRERVGVRTLTEPVRQSVGEVAEALMRHAGDGEGGAGQRRVGGGGEVLRP